MCEIDNVYSINLRCWYNINSDVGKVDLMICEKAKMVVSAHNHTNFNY